MYEIVPFVNFGQSPLTIGTTGSPAGPLAAGVAGAPGAVGAVPGAPAGGGVVAGIMLVGNGWPPLGAAGVVAGGNVAGGVVAGGGVVAITGETGTVPVEPAVTAPVPAAAGFAPIADEPASAVTPEPGAAPLFRVTVLSSEPHAAAAAIKPTQRALVRMLVRAIILTSPMLVLTPPCHRIRLR
jgi:hypothetical protein